MTRTLTLGLAALTGLGLVACEEKTTTLGGVKTVDDCIYQTGKLAGTTWVYNKAATDGSGTRSPDVQARLKFYDEDGATKAKYTVGSYSDVYTYNCKLKGEGDSAELYCEEEYKLVDYCKSLLVLDPVQECTPEKMKVFAPDASDEEIGKAAEEAKKTVDEYRGKDVWPQFVFNNNNLGNKLKGMLWARVRSKQCYLEVTDMYMTIYNGEKREDSNPVGTDQFIPSEEEFMWEHCTDSGDLIAMKTDKFPETEEEVKPCIPNEGCTFATGETVYYHYIGMDGRTTKEGCTYSFDTWTEWRPLSKDNEAPIVDFKKAKEARYGFSTSFDSPGAKVTEIVRYATCDGKKEQVEVSCNLVLVQ